jgi:insertion element IS1 protein InsB
VTAVERETRCILGWAVVPERTTAMLQAVIDQVPDAFQYCTDDFVTYHTLNYHRGFHLVAPGKSETYAVEAVNAELRHYLARLTRRSRCFSKCIEALRTTLQLFVTCWNRRQLHRRRYPRYVFHLCDFLPVLV